MSKTDTRTRTSESRSGSSRRFARVAGSALIAALMSGCAYIPGTASPVEQYRKRLAQQKEIERAAEVAALDEPGKPDFSIDEKLRKGDHARDQDDIPRAIVEYYEAYQLDPDDPRAMERIGFIQLSTDAEVAELTFSELVKTHPDSAASQRGLGLARLAQNRHEQALPPLQRAFELDDGSAITSYALSVALELEGDHEAAFEFAKRAYELAPVDARISANLGVTHMLRGDYAEAEELLRRATLISPGTASHHNNLGLTLGMMQRYDEALAQFQAAGNGEQSSRNNLGYVYFLNGEFDHAVDEYERALLAEGEDDATILANLNRALDMRNRKNGLPPEAAPAALSQVGSAKPVAIVAGPGSSLAAALATNEKSAGEGSPR